MTGPTTLQCPKCAADMRTFERSGVTVDQCTGCRGVFLDRGELERLVDAEGAFYAGAAGSPPGPRPAPPRRTDERYRSGGHGDSRGEYDDHGRRRGFLGGLFD